METTTVAGSSVQAAPIAHARTVLILGMHRSGTSALSRVLNLMGVELGQDLLPPAPDNNETGFWEHRLLQWINQRIFESVGREWNTVLALPQRWWEQPQIEGLRAELRLVIGGEFGRSALWGLKDPRVCFMLPLWRPLLQDLNCEAFGVLIFRNPGEVARSLEKRDHLPRSQCYLMWLRSLIEAERGSRELPRTLIRYESLLSDWKMEIGRIGRDLKIQWPMSMEEITPAVEEFLRPSLRHHAVDDRRFLDDSSVPELVRRGYGAVLEAISSGSTDELSRTVDAMDRELGENHPMIARYVEELERVESTRFGKIYAEQKRIQEELNAKLEEERATGAADRSVAEREREQLLAAREHTVQLEQHQEKLVGQLSGLRQELDAARQHTSDLERHQEMLVGQLAGLRQELDAARQHTSDLERHQGTLVEQLTALQQEIARRQAEIAAARQHAIDLEQHQGRLVAQLNSLSEELKAAKAEREQTVLQLNATIDNLGHTIADLHQTEIRNAQTIAERDQSIIRQDEQLARLRCELAGYQQQRQILHEVMQKVWRTRSWRWTSALRSMQKRPLTHRDMIAATPMENLGPNRWRSAGSAHFIVPCLPLWGNVHVRLKLKCSVKSEALLYFDSGRFFNELQHFHLGTVEGELNIEKDYELSEPVYCFRLDASQSAAEFEIETFEIRP